MDDVTDISEASYDTFTNASATPWGTARSSCTYPCQSERLPDRHGVRRRKADLNGGRQQRPVFQPLISEASADRCFRTSRAPVRSLRNERIAFSALSRRCPAVHSQWFSDANVYQTLPISPTLRHPEDR